MKPPKPLLTFNKAEPTVSIQTRPNSGFTLSALIVSIFVCLTVAVPADAQVLWSDEFNSGTTPDAATWSYDLGANGWGNQELQDYTSNPENVRVEGGNLVITAREKVPGNRSMGFSSARIKTENKLTFKYGTIEARISFPDLADGLWPAFWTLGNNFSQVGWPDSGELDIVEMGSTAAISAGQVNRRVSSAAHWENQGLRADFGAELDAASDLNGEFHLFKMEWTPTLITTSIDGEQIWAMDITSQSCTDCTEFHQPHFLILNLAVGGSFTGRFTSDSVTAATPAEMLVDYVRISNNGFTEMGGTGYVSGPLDIGPGHSGSWYNVDQSGHGFSMEFGQLPDGTPLAGIYWFTYDVLGNPIFMLGTGVPDGNSVVVSFESPVGMIYGEFIPESVIREVGGTALIEFSDQDNATFSYTPSEFSITNWGHTEIENLPLVKLFGIPAPAAFTPQEQ